MKGLRTPRAMWLKAVWFVVIGVAAAILVALELRSLRGIVLIGLSLWAFCRAYYFAF